MFKDQMANTVDPDETIQYQLSHLDLQCLQIQLLALQGLNLGMKRFQITSKCIFKLHVNKYNKSACEKCMSLVMRHMLTSQVHLTLHILRVLSAILSIQNFKSLAIFCGCTAWFVSDLVGSLKTDFLTMRLL